MQASTQEVPACPQGPIIMPDIVSFTERLKKKISLGKEGSLDFILRGQAPEVLQSAALILRNPADSPRIGHPPARADETCLSHRAVSGRLQVRTSRSVPL